MARVDQVVDRPGQEEFIWAMRARALNTDKEDKWRDRHINLAGHEVELTTSEKKIQKEKEMFDNGTKVASTLLCDEIITDPLNYNVRFYDAAIARGVIYGVDDLWEKYRVIGKGGPSHMGIILNTYISGIMQETFTFDGDVIRCTDRGFTIMWKQSGRQMTDCVHQAVDCSLSIVKYFNTCPLRADLGVAIAICAGPVFFTLIGTPKLSKYILTGDPMEDSKEYATRLSQNQIIIDQGAWDYLNSSEYIASVAGEDFDSYLITDFSTAWRSVQSDAGKGPRQSIGSDEELTETSIRELTKHREKQELYELRPTLVDAVNMRHLPNLKRFIFPPLLKLIEIGEPIDVNIRMRYSVIMYCRYEFESQSYSELMEVTDNFYKMINNIIERYNGYIARISYSDNELKLTVPFGMYGDSQDADSGNALKAAMKCFKGSENTTNLHSLAIAVVSGWVFSGPLGHNMRKEYFAVGQTFQRARTQAISFPNKVTCDKDTFLRSKLESRNFILQDKQEVQMTTKFAAYGLPYQYIEFDTSNRLPKLVLNKYPLLDRVYEIEIFKKMLITFSTTVRSTDLYRFRLKYEPSAIFFLNDPSSGNTRLIEELTYLTPAEFPTFRLRLTDPDKYVPYQTVYLIFGVPLGIAENSTIVDREAKLLSKLKTLPLDGLECVLNVIFRVNFPKSSAVNNMCEKELFFILKDLIKCLCRICFNRPWVIFIDSAENIDSDSWELLYSIMETHSLILVVAVGCRRSHLPPIARNVICRTKSKCIQILPIDKLYHATLACQLLEVLAIPVQLERVLQAQCGGNPGWVQKFLLSLIDQEILVIRKVVNISDFQMKVIMPIKECMTREVNKLRTSISVRNSRTLLQPAIALNREKWEIFQTIVKIEEKAEHEEIEEYYIKSQASGSGETTTARSASIASVGGPRHRTRVSTISSHKSEPSFRERQLDDSVGVVDICVLSPAGEELITHHYVSSSEKEFRPTRMLDNLTSFELHFLKCAAIIGECFLRDTLMFVMESNNECLITRACERLFELRIIACAEGDFRKPLMNYAPTYTDRFKVYDDTLIQCNCVGCLIPESCRDYAKYSNCGYMRFVCLQLKELVYNLLTTTQLMDLHTKAINFLEKSTRKCNSCGNGVFTKILGNMYEEVISNELKGLTELSSNSGEQKNSANFENWDVILHNTVNPLKRFERTKSKVKRHESGSIFSQFTKSGFYIQRTRIPLNFDDMDFTCCECGEILRCLYFNLRHHYEVTARYEKWLYATFEYSELCIDDANVALALKMLNSAWQIIKGPYKSICNPGEAWKYNVMKARVMTEIGRARSQIGQSRSAYQAFEKALSYYGYTLPKPSSCRYRMMEFTEYLRLTTKTRRGIGKKYGYTAEFSDNVSSCLCKMTKLLMKLELWENAYIAALWSLRKALKSEKNFVILINAFSILLSVSARMRKYNFVDTLELMALDYCRRYTNQLDVNDLRSISKLYTSIFYVRVQRGRIEEAFSIGITLDTITDMLQLKRQLIKLFPLFFELLLIQSDLNDVINAFTTFEQVTSLTGEYIGNVWFHALAIYFHLQTGCMLVNINLAENYYYTQCKRLINLTEPEAEKRYFVGMWLWHLRNENFDVADIWQKKLPQQWKVDQYESINNLITILMYIEGLITILTQKMDRRILLSVEDMYKLIANLISEMEEHALKIKLIAPRLYHLKAYFCMCKMEESRAWSILNQSIKISQNMKNIYDGHWAQHSARAWKHDMSSLERTWWRDHAETKTEYREMELNTYKIMFYTLELPLYV